ncbi:hypothetical protein BD770DRAFT_473497 [Pilaira anomala]|nr:hypothetical protein BD770DRAFT_473497 [Pilaira anomala]
MLMIHNNNISDSTTTTTTASQPVIERMIPLPSVLIDFMAMTLCDLIPPRRHSDRRRGSLPAAAAAAAVVVVKTLMPELIYFIQKITFQAGINCRTALVSLIYLKRAKRFLPRGAVGGHDTSHRLFLGSILIASKFLCTDNNNNNNRTDVVMITHIPSTWSHYYSFHPVARCYSGGGPLSNRKLTDICSGLFDLNEMNQLERAFLKLIQYQCWVDEKEIHDFVLKHRVDFSL